MIEDIQIQDKNKDLTYDEALHAVQTGVAMMQRYDLPVELQCTAIARVIKHLRLGINSAMCQHTGLVRMLLARGLIDEADYAEQQRLEMIREVERYEADILKHLGGGSIVTLR
jgi:hypothetical protein